MDAELVAFDSAALSEQSASVARTRLRELAEDLVPPTIACDFRVVIGKPLDEIVKAAEASVADLIIMSTHGYTGLKHAFLGSTTETVVRHAPCPVLTLREHEHDFVHPLLTKDQST